NQKKMSLSLDASKGGIVVIGACNTDLITYTDRTPKPGETLKGTSFSTGFGGKGANQAVMAAILMRGNGETSKDISKPVVMISRLGDDFFGESTLKNFQEKGVDTSLFGPLIPGESSGVAAI